LLRETGSLANGKEIITPPWTVLSPAEKGGRLGVGLAPLPRKSYAATETPMMNRQTPQVLGEEGLSSRRCMTSCRENRKEPATLTTLLLTRKTLNIGTWNIRTMFESGKTAQVANGAGLAIRYANHLAALAVKP